MFRLVRVIHDQTVIKKSDAFLGSSKQIFIHYQPLTSSNSFNSCTSKYKNAKCSKMVGFMNRDLAFMKSVEEIQIDITCL